MPLTLNDCGTQGGDIEMTAMLFQLAAAYPNDEIWLLGRNSGQDPAEIGLPPNVINPWCWWKKPLQEAIAANGLKHVNLSVNEQFMMQHIHDELTLPTFLNMDGFVMWVGQHGTTNAPLPSTKDPAVLTKPYDFSTHYVSYILRGINAWRDVDPWNREEIWINADPRNYHKMRDLKWPLRHPVLTQYNFTNNIKHARYDNLADPIENMIARWGDYAQWTDEHHNTWSAKVQNVYSRLEFNALVPGTPSGDILTHNDSWDDRHAFGLFINEARAIGVPQERGRLKALTDWVLPLDPHFIHGKWSDKAQAELGFPITPLPWTKYVPKLHTIRTTFTTPSSGSGWATTKPWEAFAAGVVCFFHPLYDTQDNIFRGAPMGLKDWLRVKTPEELKTRMAHLNSTAGRPDWEWLVKAQHQHFDDAVRERKYMKMIDERLRSTV
jgi:hypothetical protein